MGKHKRKSHSRDRESEKLWKKIKQLEEKMKSTPAHDPPDVAITAVANNNEGIPSNSANSPILPRQKESPPITEPVCTEIASTSGAHGSSDTSVASVSDTPVILPQPNIQDIPDPTKESDSVIAERPISPLEEDVMKIIGESPEVKQNNLVLLTHITSRWKNWLKVGQQKDVKNNLLSKYPRTGECLLEAPKLNPEVAASLTESSLKRDKYMCITQNLVGSALSALGLVIEPLMTQKKDTDPKKMLEHLWEASQLLTEIHYNQTKARKACIIPTVDKSVATVLEKIETDSFLFGEKLGDQIREAKSVNKLGSEIKTQGFIKKKPFHPNQSNWQGPSAARATTQTGYKKKFFPKSSQFRPKQSAQPKQTQNQYHYQKPQNYKQK